MTSTKQISDRTEKTEEKRSKNCGHKRGHKERRHEEVRARIELHHRERKHRVENDEVGVEC